MCTAQGETTGLARSGWKVDVLQTAELMRGWHSERKER